MMGAILLALCFELLAWVGEGRTSFAVMTVSANTVATCAGYAVIFFFMLYLRENLFPKSRRTAITINIFFILCILSMLLISVNAWRGVSYHLDAHGHYVYTRTPYTVVSHFLFPVLSVVTTLFLLARAKGVRMLTRSFYLIYILFPVIGVLLDYLIHGLSLTYIGMVVSTLIIYTNIYLQKRTLIAEQKNTLLMSQINPHFTYNTLSAIASLCDLDPKQAKNLTMEFSSFLRANLESLSSSEPITFEQELRHVDCYLKIEKARFGDKINIQYRIETDNFLLPALTVQPLVENAVRYGVTKKAGGGTVWISAYQTARLYVVEIKDNGIGFNPNETANDQKRHVGLQNVRTRVQNYGGRLQIESAVGEGTCVRMEIPRKKRS